MEFIIVYATAPNMPVAKKIARHLLEKKIIVCANIFPVESGFLWEGKIKNVKECVMILKTLEENFEKLKTEVKAMHPYEIPCMIKIAAEPNSKYFAWVRKELGRS